MHKKVHSLVHIKFCKLKCTMKQLKMSSWEFITYYNLHELCCALLQIQLRVFQTTLDQQSSNALNTASNLWGLK